MSEAEMLLMIAQEALDAIRRDLGGKHEEEDIQAAADR